MAFKDVQAYNRQEPGHGSLTPRVGCGTWAAPGPKEQDVAKRPPQESGPARVPARQDHLQHHGIGDAVSRAQGANRGPGLKEPRLPDQGEVGIVV